MLSKPWIRLNMAVRGVVKRTASNVIGVYNGRTMRLANAMTATLAVHPVKNKAGFASLGRFLNTAKPMNMPRTVENSAKAFMNALTTSPLRTRIASIATIEVVAPDVKPERKKDSTIGIPVKSNFRYKSHGKTILKPENFIA
jgi:hypothetical protein